MKNCRPKNAAYDWPCGCTNPPVVDMYSTGLTRFPSLAFAPTNRVIAENKAFVISPTERLTYRVPFRSLGGTGFRGRRKSKLSFSDRKYRRSRRNRLPDRFRILAH
jgi:hypothetical protein